MAGNFTFLKEKWPELSEMAGIAEENLYCDPNTTIFKLRLFAEQLVDYMFAYDELEEPEENSLYNKLKLLEREELIDGKITDIFHALRTEGNKAAHEDYKSLEEAQTLLSLSHKLAVWFMQVYGDWDFEPKKFRIPEKDEQDDLEKLAEKYDEIIQQLQKEIKQIKESQRKTVDLDQRIEKSKKYGDQLIFSGEENKIISFSEDREGDITEVDSAYKFITTDIIDPESQQNYVQAWGSVRRAFSGRQCVAYWRYPLFSKRGESRKEPDIIIVDKKMGVIVLEVREYQLENIVEADDKSWKFADGSTASPLYDVEDQFYALRGLYQNNRSLRNITEKYGIILPAIKESDWQQKNFYDENIIFSDQLGSKTFLNKISDFKGTGSGHELDNEAWNDILLALTGQVTYSEEDAAGGSGERLREDEESGSLVKTITGLFTGKNNKNKKKKRSQVKSIIKEDVYEVDMQQEIIGKTIPPGPQRIRGIAGSGKTVLLAQKAAHMHLKHPDWKIALIFFTRSLYDNVLGEVDKWLKRFSGGETDFNLEENENLQILHAWGAKDQPGFYSKMCRAHNAKFLHAMNKKLGDGDPNEKLIKACKILLEEVDQIKPIYNAILIDEAQDLIVDDKELKYEDKQPFYWLAYQAIKPNTNGQGKRLIWAYDEAQSLNSLNVPTAPELFGDKPEFRRMVSGFHEGGIRKSEIMNKCYRTPGPVLTAAHAIGMGLLRPERMLRGYTTQEDWENIGYEILEGSFNPPGQKVILHRPDEMTPNRVQELWPEEIVKFNRYNSREEELKKLAEKIKYNIDVDGLEPSRDILVIVLGHPREAFNLKIEAAKAIRAAGIDIYIPKSLKNNIFRPKYPSVDPDKFWNEGGVTISHTFRAKGNEAYMVYVIGLDTVAEDEDNFTLRNQLFVALTRTKGWLEVSGIGDYPMYKEFEQVLKSKGTFEFTFRRPLAEKIKNNETGSDTKTAGNNNNSKAKKSSNDKNSRKIKVNDVVELSTGERAKVIAKNNSTLTVKISGNKKKQVKEKNCEFIREGKQYY